MMHIASGYPSLVLYESMASQRTFKSSHDNYKKVNIVYSISIYEEDINNLKK